MNPIAECRQQWHIVGEQKLLVSEWFDQELELKLPNYSTDFSSKKKDKCFFTEEFQTNGLQSTILISICKFPCKFKISLKKKKRSCWAPMHIKLWTVVIKSIHKCLIWFKIKVAPQKYFNIIKM